jgi:hypothetical protein
MEKRSLLFIALALATGCRCTPLLAAENTNHRADGIHEVADEELATMRGRYIVGDNAVLWFGVEMVSTWQTSHGQALQSTLTLGMDFSKNAQQPKISFVPTVTITNNALPDATASNISRHVLSAGLANVSGMMQSVQIAGDGNAASNVARLSIQSSSAGASANTLANADQASSLSTSTGDASASSTYANDNAQVTVSVNGLGSASQWIRPGSLGQTIALTADNQIVTNQMIVSMVTQASGTSTSQLAHNLAQSLTMNHGNR